MQYAANALAESVRYIAAVGADDSAALSPLSDPKVCLKHGVVVGGVYTPIAQAMMAFQLGGAAYTHVVAEGKPKELGGVVVFSCVTLTAQVQHGALGLGAALGAHALLGALGNAQPVERASDRATRRACRLGPAPPTVHLEHVCTLQASLRATS